MKKMLLTAGLGLVFATAYSQTGIIPGIKSKEATINYGQKKEKPRACIFAKNLGEDKNYLDDKYFSINLTDEIKRKIPGSKLEKMMGVLSAVLFNYEGRYIGYEKFIDGKDENIELKRIIVGEIGEDNKNNFETKEDGIKDFYGKRIIFLEYSRDGKIEQIPYILNEKESIEELIKNLKK